MRTHSVLLALSAGLVPGLGGLALAQAVPRTDTPRRGAVRATFEPLVETWDAEFTQGARRGLGASLPARAFVHAERRTTPLALEVGITDRVALAARVPVVRAMIRAHLYDDSAGRALDSLLADTAYGFAAIANTRRGLRYFAGDAEASVTVRLAGASGRSPYAVAAVGLVRFPTGHLDSPHDLFDIPTGDHQRDLEVRLIQELTIAGRLWLNVMVRAARQEPGMRDRRVAAPTTVLPPHAATARLAWDPGDYVALDVAPLYRFNRYFGAGVTAGYWSRARDRYRFAAAQDSIDLAARLGAPLSAGVLDAVTSERRLRLGGAVSYAGPVWEGSLSVEQTVSGAGGPIPAATVFRIVMRTWRRLF